MFLGFRSRIPKFLYSNRQDLSLYFSCATALAAEEERIIQELVELDTEASALPQSGSTASASCSSAMNAGGLKVFVSGCGDLVL